MIKVEKSSEIKRENDVYMAKCTAHAPGSPMSVYSFNVDGILIDAGSSSLLEEFTPYFQEADFDAVYITHFHEDHTGNVAYLQNERDIPAYIHPSSAPFTLKPFRIPTYRQVVWGNSAPFSSIALGQTFNSRRHTWEVIETPGHTKDHVAFYNRDMGAVFTGDLFVSPKVKVVLAEENIIDTRASLQKVLAYDFDDMYCCHAGYVKDAKKRLQLKIDYIDELEHKVLTLAKQGKDIHEITAELFPTPYPIIAVSHTEWSPVHMVRVLLNRG